MDLTTIKEFHTSLTNSPVQMALMNAISQNTVTEVCKNLAVSKNHNHIFSHEVSIQPKATNQKSSGRCWLFAALNVIRVLLMKEYNLDKDFELSQSYLFFWDKYERVNYFIETMFSLAMEGELNPDDRLIWHLLDSPMGDGGQWDMITSLVEKYGLIPQSVERESHSSSYSRNMNKLLTNKLREYANFIYANKDDESFIKSKDSIKKVMLGNVYEILFKTLGKPVLPDQEFTWTYIDKKGNKHVKKTTPLDFYKDMVPLDMSKYMCVIHDPRNAYYQLYTVKYLGNVWNTKHPVLYLNLPIDEMKQLISRTIQEDEPVWFGCDMGKDRNADLSLMDTNVMDYENAFGTGFHVMNKKDRLVFRESLMTHAMVITGFDTDEDCGERPKKRQNVEETCKDTSCKDKNDKKEIKTFKKFNKWKIENSWGSKGDTNGYYTMMDNWFDEYVYEVAIKKDKLSTYELNFDNVTELEYWDPMGALA